ncbi:MAG TPA: hypothetical protein VKA27_13420, partial [Sunxiuqinia sp.]|nr:hypothetical protein [Sunxiuqinia sp.]
MGTKQDKLSHNPTNIFHFNPTCELALANGSPYYHPPALLKQFEEELSPIMLFFAGEHDHVLKSYPTSESFIDNMYQLGLTKSSILMKSKSLEIISQHASAINFHPWGWSPAELHFFKNYKEWNAQKQLV